MAELSVKQESAINELNSVVDNAENIKISVATLNRWLTQKEFKDTLTNVSKIL